MPTNDALFLGLDVGTSGVRACAVDAAGEPVATAETAMPAPRRDGPAVEHDPEVWWQATVDTLHALRGTIDLARLRRIAVDGTSGTLLLVDAAGRPLTPGLMYNDARAAEPAGRIAAVAPPESGAHGPTSALAKLLHVLAEGREAGAAHAVHQADWIAGRLTGRQGVSDENNALKLGYDPVARRWPGWLDALGVPRPLLPTVLTPGLTIGRVSAKAAAALGLSDTTEIVAGTTDGVAAFLATRAAAVGDAVTSLGTTLVVKVMSERPVFAPAQGVYSHRLGDRWLAGGASNSGGAALLAHFDAATIEALTPRLDPEHPTGLHYYPLPAPGERFPIADPAMPSRTEPRPADDATFLQALLEGIAEVEALAYARLAEFGAPRPRRVLSVGGGSRNAAWERIRGRVLGVPVATAARTDAAYGTALLALAGGVPS
ncbi:MAG: FGGY-family carbohydrate kinase [Rhodospirillaceae bacterium]|nr:FGGY-family carbohydrate kinase [Rhodospirillaceae bacterium]